MNTLLVMMVGFLILTLGCWIVGTLKKNSLSMELHVWFELLCLMAFFGLLHLEFYFVILIFLGLGVLRWKGLGYLAKRSDMAQRKYRSEFVIYILPFTIFLSLI